MDDPKPGGPIVKFLKQAKLREAEFAAKLEAGDLQATILFAADVLHGDLLDLMEYIESVSDEAERVAEEQVQDPATKATKKRQSLAELAGK